LSLASISKAVIPVRIRRLKELAGKLSVEALRVCQHRNPLKPDEIKAYSSNLVQAISIWRPQGQRWRRRWSG
jgi:hypothetical protein